MLLMVADLEKEKLCDVMKPQENTDGILREWDTQQIMNKGNNWHFQQKGKPSYNNNRNSQWSRFIP